MTVETTVITVNGRECRSEDICISYDEVVTLSGLSGSPSVIYCSKRDGDVRRQGTMYSGCPPLLISDAMTFTVAHTGGA